MSIKKHSNRAVALVLLLSIIMSMVSQVAWAATVSDNNVGGGSTYVCGMTEHSHSSACYEDKGYEYQCFDKLEETQATNDVKQWKIVHEHNELCYLDGELICDIPEHAAHVHTDACYEIPVQEGSGIVEGADGEADGEMEIEPQSAAVEPVLICGQEDTSSWPVHNHNEKCMPAEHKLVLVCGREEHKHDESCLAPVVVPTAEPTATPEPIAPSTPIVTQEPIVTPEPTVTPAPTATPEATATPEPTATPKPTATVEPSEEPAVTDEPADATATLPGEMDVPDADNALAPSEDDANAVALEPAVEFTPQVMNTVVGTTASAAFTFKIQYVGDSDTVFMPENTATTVKGNGFGVFDAIGFAEAGVYQFNISEQAGGSNLYRYDARTYTLTATVVDNNGALTVVSEYKLNSDNAESRTDCAAFINTYTNAPGWSAKTVELANKMMAKMTTEEKVGQLFLLHYPSDGAGTAAQAKTLIDKYHPGGFLVFGAAFKNSTPAAFTKKISDTQAASKIPLLISIDEEGGKVNRASLYTQFRSEPFKGPQDLKAAGGLSAVSADAVDKAAFLKNLGVNVNHAPVADTSGPSGYIYARTYGGNGAENAKYVETVVKASEGAGMATTMKHFPGYGGTSSDTHNGFAVNNLTWEDFLYNDLLPFQAGMNAGGHAVMVTHNTVNCLDSTNPSSLSPAVYNMLRNTMKFDGVAMTDDLAMSAITNYVGSGQASLRALQAGADIAMTATPDADIPVVLAAAQNGSLSLSDIETKCRRVLCWKIEMGLLTEANIEDPNAPVDAEARYISSNGSTTKYGSFLDMWAAAQQGNGRVELLKDVSITSNLWVGSGENIVLDLRGHELSASAEAVVSDLIYVNTNGTLEITDNESVIEESAAAASEKVGYDSSNGILVYNNGNSLRRVDFSRVGKINGNNRIARNGSLIINHGDITLSGGMLMSNTAFAYGIYTTESGSLNIKGGIIFAQQNCVYAIQNNTSFAMSGGYLISSAGNGISWQYGESCTITGGVIAACTQGGIFARKNPLSVSGCCVSGNKLYGIFWDDADVQLRDCTIVDNRGGGVVLDDDGTGVSIGGRMQITGNTNGGVKCNVNLKTNQNIVIQNPLTTDSSIGVTVHGNRVVVATSTQTLVNNENQCFKPDDRTYTSVLDRAANTVVFTKHEVQVYTIIEGVPTLVGTMNGGDILEGRKLYIKDLPSALNNYGFTKDTYSGAKCFGFSNTASGVVMVPEGQPAQDENGWYIPVPADLAEDFERIYYLPNSAEPGSYDLDSIIESNNLYAVTVDDGFNGAAGYPSVSRIYRVPAGQNITFTLPGDKSLYAWEAVEHKETDFKCSIEQTSVDTVTVTISDIHAPCTIFNHLYTVKVDDVYGRINLLNDVSKTYYVPVGQDLSVELPNRNSACIWQVSEHKESDFGISMAESGASTLVSITNLRASCIISSNQGGLIDIRTYIMVDGESRMVGITKNVLPNTKRFYWNDLPATLKDYRFDANDSTNSQQFGFTSTSFSQISVLETAPSSDYKGLYTSIPEDMINRNARIYYLPNGGLQPGAYSEAEIMATNGFYSVTISDLFGQMQDGVENHSTVYYVPVGQSVTFELPIYSNGWTWEVNEHDEADFTYSIIEKEGAYQVTISNIHAPVVVSSVSGENIQYTVQYYATVQSLNLDTSGKLEIIDTTGKTLPRNGTTPHTKWLTILSDGSVKRDSTLVPVYSEKNYLYNAAPGLVYVDRLYTDDHYELTELWVLKDGRDKNSTNRDDWDIYNKAALGLKSIHDLHLTSIASNVVPNDTIYVAEGTTMRFVYEPTIATRSAPVTFYDYDISDGYIYGSNSDASNQNNPKKTSSQSSTRSYINTIRKGINSKSNYSGTNTNRMFAFGNANTGTGLENESLDGNFFNKFNRVAWGQPALGFKGCFFGIANSLNTNGTIQYNPGIDVPNLFNDGDAVGKTTIDGHQLMFSRVGDSYTLEAVSGTSATNLSKFVNPQSKYPNI